MSEINGQLLGILIVIGVFGIVAGTVTAVVTNLSDAIEEKSNEIIENNLKPSFETESYEVSIGF